MAFSLYQLKPRFQQLLSPLLAGLERRRITPNQLTLATMLLSIIYGALLAWRHESFAVWAGFPVFMLLRMMLNAIDGMLANATNQKTALGALLNEMCDQVSDLALYLPFCLLPGLAAPLVLAAVILGLLAEYAGLCALAVGSERRFDGPMGKSDRAFAYGLLVILAQAGAAPLVLNGLLTLVCALLLLTMANRLRQALRQR
jgi:CDP-diacylglycerol--glycerol-3-phosphate 3-phosphatidyltransferase